MTAHSLLGASSAYRWLACPGSFKLSQEAPHRPSSIYAATGTAAHALIEEAVRAGADEIALGKPDVLCDGHVVAIDQEFIDGVNVMLAYLGQITALSDWSDTEFRVSLDGYFTSPPVPLFGTVDAGALSLWNETLEIVDYKNGSGVVVRPNENPQLLFYAAGVLALLPVHQRRWVQNVKLTVVQPNASGVSPIRSWEINVVDLLMWMDEVLIPGVEACAQPDAPLVPGPHCRFCPVSHACPRLHEDAVAMAKQDFDDLPKDPTELADVLDQAERAELWITRVREFAVDQLQRQVRIPGWGLVPTRPTRKWTLPEDEVAERLLYEGLGRPDVWEQRLRSPAQIEKLLRRRGIKGRGWDDLADDLIEARSSGVKLGRTGTDAREEFIDE